MEFKRVIKTEILIHIILSYSTPLARIFFLNRFKYYSGLYV